MWVKCLDSTDSIVHGSQHDSTTRDVNRRVLFWFKLLERAISRCCFWTTFKHRSDREGVPDSIATCALASLLHAPRVDATVEHSLEPLDATHGPPVASRETVVSRDLTLTETHQDKDGTQPWESRA